MHLHDRRAAVIPCLSLFGVRNHLYVDAVKKLLHDPQQASFPAPGPKHRKWKQEEWLDADRSQAFCVNWPNQNRSGVVWPTCWLPKLEGWQQSSSVQEEASIPFANLCKQHRYP